MLFVGDLAGYRHSGGLDTARRVAPMGSRAVVIPGNHDAVVLPELIAEMTGARTVADAMP